MAASPTISSIGRGGKRRTEEPGSRGESRPSTPRSSAFEGRKAGRRQSKGTPAKPSSLSNPPFPPYGPEPCSGLCFFSLATRASERGPCQEGGATARSRRRRGPVESKLAFLYFLIRKGKATARMPWRWLALALHLSYCGCMQSCYAI